MRDKKENLLSASEIHWVENSVNNKPALKYPFAIGEVSHRLSILKVTSEKGLVFIWGDNDTGFNHLNDRHNYWSEKTYWEKKNEIIKLGDPSKFSKQSLPIIDYSKISEALYVEGNLNMKRNKHPELFDVYVGEVEDETRKFLRYRMVLYKGTKIVHTLFPEQPKHNKKRVEINLRRGKANGKLFFEHGKLEIAVSYYDINDIAIYSFHSCRDFIKKHETGFLISHRSGKKYNLFERKLEKFSMLEYKAELEKMDLADLSNVEKCIKKLKKVK